MQNNGMMLVAEWINPAKNRYYKVLEGCDLFGQCLLVRVWGGLGTKTGGCMQELLESAESAKSSLAKIAKERKTRGYEMVH